MLIIAKTSNALESFFVKICVIINNIAINVKKTSNEKTPKAVVIIKNQKENPAVTDRLLNLGLESSKLNRID